MAANFLLALVCLSASAQQLVDCVPCRVFYKPTRYNCATVIPHSHVVLTPVCSPWCSALPGVCNPAGCCPPAIGAGISCLPPWTFADKVDTTCCTKLSNVCSDQPAVSLGCKGGCSCSQPSSLCVSNCWPSCYPTNCGCGYPYPMLGCGSSCPFYPLGCSECGCGCDCGCGCGCGCDWGCGCGCGCCPLNCHCGLPSCCYPYPLNCGCGCCGHKSTVCKRTVQPTYRTCCRTR